MRMEREACRSDRRCPSSTKQEETMIVIDYKTLYAPTVKDLDKQVRAACAEGWAPWGEQHYDRDTGFRQVVVWMES